MESVQDIRDRARAHNLRMNAVCREAGIQPPQVSRWLSGAVSPLWSSINDLSMALDRLVQAGEAAPSKTPAPAAPDKTD